MMASRQPQRLGEVLNELFARRGYARRQAQANYAMVWSEAAGKGLAAHTRVARVVRGRMEVIVASSTLVQELTFRKSELIEKLAGQLPEAEIRDLRFRVGRVR